jgi:transketolase
LVPDEVREHFTTGVGARGATARAGWERMMRSYRETWPDMAGEIDLMQRREPPAGWDADLPTFPAAAHGPSSRESSGQVLNAIAANVPWLLGGAADLAPSTKTTLTGDGDVERDRFDGRNLHFGIREHAMCAVANGLSLAKLRPFAAGFFIFTDYARGAIRLSALMELPMIYLWTHDSISLGQDGPTHQPIEQLASFRAMPGMTVIRPADANEVLEAWRVFMPRRHGPTMLVLSRQGLPTLDRARFAPAAGLALGGYVLADPRTGDPEVILIGTGSEVALCVDAWEQLTTAGVRARVVSLPSFDLFEQQDEAYRDEVLPDRIRARVAVEAAGTYGWERYVGLDGVILGMHTFGASAPLKKLLRTFGFQPEHIVQAARDAMRRAARVQVGKQPG